MGLYKNRYMEELQTQETDSTSAEGDLNVNSEAVVSQLNQIAGREFKSVDDFQEHYKHLTSFVGKKDESGEKLTALLAKAKPFADAYGVEPDEFLETYLDNPNLTEDDLRSKLSTNKELSRQSQTSEELKQIKSELEVARQERARESFQKTHPEAVELMSVIEAVAAKQNISLDEALKDSSVKKLIEITREQKGNSIIQTNQKVANTDSDLTRKRQNVSQSTDALADYLSANGVQMPE